jgi:hypothetical protein
MSLRPDPPRRNPCIEQQLCATLATWALEAAVLQPGVWADLADLDPTQLHHPYGWIPPTLQCWVAPRTVLCCPEIIEQQTSGMPAEQRASYLVALAVSADIHHRFESLPSAERIAAVDDVLYDQFPDLLRTLTDVSMAALDELRASQTVVDRPEAHW